MRPFLTWLIFWFLLGTGTVSNEKPSKNDGKGTDFAPISDIRPVPQCPPPCPSEGN